MTLDPFVVVLAFALGCLVGGAFVWRWTTQGAEEWVEDQVRRKRFR